MVLIKHGLGCYTEGSVPSEDVSAFAESNVRQLLLCALGCLFSEEARVQQMALKGLLTVIAEASKSLSPSLSMAVEQSLWLCAR